MVCSRTGGRRAAPPPFLPSTPTTTGVGTYVPKDRLPALIGYV